MDPRELMLDDMNNGTALGCLFISYFILQIVQDIIYVYQDVPDNEKTGVRSMAVFFEEQMSLILSRLGQMCVALLALTGLLIDAGLVFYVFAVAGTGVWLWLTMWKVDLKDPVSCAWWVRYGGVFVGGIIALGLLGERMIRADRF